MSTQPRSDLKFTPPARVSRNALNPFGAKDLTVLAATLSPVRPSAREALIATAPYRQSEFRKDFAEYICAAPLATGIIDAAIAAEHFNAPTSALKARGLRSRTAPRGKPRTGEGWQDHLASVEGLTVALRRARARSEAASRARQLLAGAQRDLCEPLTAMLRLTSDWNVRGTDIMAVRIIEQQRQALAVLGDLFDGFLTIGEPEMARQPALLTERASRSGGGELREASATPQRRAEEWSAEWSLRSAVGRRPEALVALGPATRTRRILLIDEDRGVLGALRIYLLCAGYQVFAAANADEGLDRARMATSLIDIIITNLDLTGEDDGLAVIDKTRLLLGYNVPAVLLTTQTSIEIGQLALVTDVYLLRNPVNLDELNALIGEVLKRPRRSRLAHLRTRGAKLGHDHPNLEVVT